jgi:hypothetical protein
MFGASGVAGIARCPPAPCLTLLNRVRQQRAARRERERERERETDWTETRWVSEMGDEAWLPQELRGPSNEGARVSRTDETHAGLGERQHLGPSEEKKKVERVGDGGEKGEGVGSYVVLGCAAACSTCSAGCDGSAVVAGRRSSQRGRIHV